MAINQHMKSIDWLSLLFLFGVFFSGVTFNIIPGETSAISFVAGLLILTFRKSLTSQKFIHYSAILILSSAYCFFFVHDNLMEIIKQLFAYGQILMVFLCARYLKFDRLEPVIKFWIFLDIFVCVLQFTGIGSGVLEPIMQFLIPRGTATQLSNIGRGVSGFTSEPSQMALGTFVHAFMLLYCGHINRKDYSLFCLIYILLGVVLSSSGTGIVLLSIFVIPLIFLKLRLVLIGTFVSIVAVSVLPLPARFNEIVKSFSFVDLDSIAAAFYISGFRFPSVVASYIFSTSDFTPGGVGSWYTKILEAYRYIGIHIEDLGHFVYTNEWVPTKPSSFFASLSLEFGLYGLIFSVIIFIKLISIIKNIDAIFRQYLLVSIFGAFFLSSVGNPSFPLILALALTGRLNRKSVDKVTS